MKQFDPDELFRLKPIKAAKVSEVSEAVASSNVDDGERINFHIGNPVQDKSLSSAYLRMILGIDIEREDLNDENLNSVLEEIEWDQSDRNKLEFLSGLIKRCAPYMPRGGFSKKNPNFLARYFHSWLSADQSEPLFYDLGEASDRREIIFTTGGIYEALRLMFHALDKYLIHTPSKILLFDCKLPDYLTRYDSINFITFGVDETELVRGMEKELTASDAGPVFLLLGKIPTESTRRLLRKISIEKNLYFIEVNDAPNNLSLAREAKLMNNVLRVLTPGVFSPSLKNLPVVFLAGASDLLNVIETVQFQLKGTPSASEIEFLSFILKENLIEKKSDDENGLKVIQTYEKYPGQILKDYALAPFIENAGNKINRLIESREALIEKYSQMTAERSGELLKRSENLNGVFLFDKFAERNALELLNDLVKSSSSPEFQKDLTESFIFSFLRHHPEYKRENVQLVSGSARTGLAMLGFICGIEEAVVPDLSWTYEHCFPKVTVVPLTEGYELDTIEIKRVIGKKISDDSKWIEYGALVLNNPHNATGKIFSNDSLQDLIKWALERKIFIIDDLSYQNVAPSAELKQIPSLRQIAEELNKTGYISDDEKKYLITIHSLSKTDSFAGARLSVIEILHEVVYEKFSKVNSTVSPNLAAIFLAYLFYRNRPETANAYWRLRNNIFLDRTDAILNAVKVLPKNRNVFEIKIQPPQGSMYPQMIIEKLPSGLSLDWLASGLARQGIGLVPLSTFARTEKGFEIGRKTFRLTLGGTDDASALSVKTRRVLIDLNRMISEEESNYSRIRFKPKKSFLKNSLAGEYLPAEWESLADKIKNNCASAYSERIKKFTRDSFSSHEKEKFKKVFLEERLSVFKNKLEERIYLAEALIESAASDGGKTLSSRLEYEFFKDNLEERLHRFKRRLYDRTVHPTQMYSLRTELIFENIINKLIRKKQVSVKLIDLLSDELVKEYLGMNVAIISGEESSELLLDLNSLVASENYFGLNSNYKFHPFISFWGDWDGTNRPSGQGHSLTAAVIIENVSRQANLLKMLMRCDKTVYIEASLLDEIQKLPYRNKKFVKLLGEITQLTHQLEKRYKGILPVNIKPGRLRKLGMSLRIANDPLTSLWHHNDRLERKMRDLRLQRRNTLEYYFSLNKLMRKTLYSLIPSVRKNIGNREILLEFSLFRDLLKRFVITPRINQKMITAQDQFAIDTTVYNINELNAISGNYGNPGLVLALQVSMSTKPDALIALDRKFRAAREEILRTNPSLQLPSIWSIPLFEDLDSVSNIPKYAEKIWEYSLQSRRIDQSTENRFCEIIVEIFIAGSDLSQQIGQAAGWNLFKQGRYELAKWLAEKGVIGEVRLKLGSGEPMQRQGGYYSEISGKPAFIQSRESFKRFKKCLTESAQKSTEYAVTPLLGIFSGGDLRTLQSNVSEKLRSIGVHDFSQLIYHLHSAQKKYETELVRAGEPLVETRLQFQKRGLKELERLTIGRKEEIFDEFLSISTENFRQILYGREEDVVGIHIISYFISRTTPPLRDRPTVRPVRNSDGNTGQRILEKISSTIPFSKYGSLLRAISHNQSQTYVLGINQLTTGLFRALDVYAQKDSSSRSTLIGERILPNLPVYEILNTLRIFHDKDLFYLKKIEHSFPAGNSAFVALREDNDAMFKYLNLFQKELLRRHGLDVNDFFEGKIFIPDLLPALRPDLAVLLQPDLFNTDPEVFLESVNGNVDEEWMNEIKKLLSVPDEIKYWRMKMWDLLHKPLQQRILSFVELAVALNSIPASTFSKEYSTAGNKYRKSAGVSNLWKNFSDDNIHEFLGAAVEFLSFVSEGIVEVPNNIVRALKEAERIIKIEEQALSASEQELLRFYLLQMARLTGENG